MKKNSFDPFMINNFSDIVKHGKSVSISNSDTVASDMMSITFRDKSSGMYIPKVRTGLVLLIDSEYIGEKSELGSSLMKNFLISIASGMELPEYIFFINSGVKMLGDENVLATLKQIKKYGTNLISSLESVEYFNIEKNRISTKWAIGDIATVLFNANRVIKL